MVIFKDQAKLLSFGKLLPKDNVIFISFFNIIVRSDWKYALYLPFLSYLFL